MKDIKKEVANTIKADVFEMVMKSLQGIEKRQSFDLGRIDWVVDNPAYHFENLSNRLSALVVDVAVDLMYPHIENLIRERIKKTM